MKVLRVWLLVSLGICILSSLGQAQNLQTTRAGAVQLENFDQYQLFSFPTQWQVRGDEATAKTVYRVVEEEGNRFLRAYAEQHDVQIGLSRSFAPEKFPVLQWRWRAKKLPEGADERVVKTNDSAAGVYVVYDNRIMPRAIKYVWSSSLPVGTRMQSPVYWRAYVVVLQSGATRLGEWQHETINLYQDYKDLFGTEPGEVQGIAILSDANMTKSVSAADYDDFVLLPADIVHAEAAKNAEAHFAPVEVDGQ